jgi:hypothetical protein
MSEQTDNKDTPTTPAPPPATSGFGARTDNAGGGGLAPDGLASAHRTDGAAPDGFGDAHGASVVQRIVEPRPPKPPEEHPFARRMRLEAEAFAKKNRAAAVVPELVDEPTTSESADPSEEVVDAEVIERSVG